MQPLLLEIEQVDMFIGVLQGPYYKKMIGSVSTGFADLVIIGEQIENGMKNGKIGKSSSSQYNNKRYSNNNNSKKGDTNVVTTDRYSHIPYNPYITMASPNQYPSQRHPLPQIKQLWSPPL